MIIFYIIVLLSVLSLSLCSYHQRRCAFNNDCWPPHSAWSDFNATISGRLVASVPSAAVCHRARYNAEFCNNATQEWNNSFWRTSQIGAYAAILWELGDDQCFIDSPVDAPCGPGLGESQAVFDVVSWRLTNRLRIQSPTSPSPHRKYQISRPG